MIYILRPADHGMSTLKKSCFFLEDGVEEEYNSYRDSNEDWWHGSTGRALA